MHVLVIGATGYVGARLVPRLLDDGHAVRCLVRDPARLRGHPWRTRVEVVPGDVTDPAATASATHGVEAAVHLVHSMDAPGFEARDRRAAQVLAAAAETDGLRRIVYLLSFQLQCGHCIREQN